MDTETKQTFDGDSEIVFAGVFNVYENKLVVKNIKGFNFTFIFEENSPSLPPTIPKKDIIATGEGKEVIVTLSSKIRNSSIGTGTTNKSEIINFSDGKKLSWSMFVQTMGENASALSVALNFYIK